MKDLEIIDEARLNKEAEDDSSIGLKWRSRVVTCKYLSS
jgi:hypothetical protein